MFYNCSSLSSLPDISKWNSNKFLNMSGLFANCSSLYFLPDISNWLIGNKIQFREYYEDKLDEELNIQVEINELNEEIEDKEKISKEYKIQDFCKNYLYSCQKYIYNNKDKIDYNPNSLYIRYMFYGCTNIIKLPDISKWDVSNSDDISFMFYDCSSLTELPDI